MKQNRFRNERRTDLRKPAATMLVILALTLSACAINASRTFIVKVSPISAQYTPGQIREFLTARGWERVAFERAVDSRTTTVLERRDGQVSEQRFILTSAPQFRVIARFEKKVRRLFMNSDPRVVVIFIENGSSSLSATGERHYELLRTQIAKRLSGELSH